MKKWQFDESTIKDAINAGNRFLLDKSISKKQRREIITDINRFQAFLNGDFELTKRKKELQGVHLKNNILKSMKKHSKLFKHDLISWLIGLEQSGIFFRSDELPPFKIDINDAANYTLDNYRYNAPLFHNYAYELLKNKKINLIHETQLNFSSYCFYSDILQLPFIVIGTDDEASALNHEIQHAIEYLLGISTNHYYSEFGPIYFETLFNDHLYNQYGNISLSANLNRIYDTKKQLEIIKCYLYCMCIFSYNNFDVDDNFFFETFQEITGLQGKELTDFLNEEILEQELNETLSYLFSFLKAIEIRSLELKNDMEAKRKFNQILYSRRFSFKKPQNGFQVYKDFVEEIKEKAR